MNQTGDNWKETMVRFLIESNLFQETLKRRWRYLEIEMCTGMFKDQAEVVVALEKVQEKIDLVENEEELIEEKELIEEEER
nr:hypothetical protein [Tanacetum cinerariifolium]